MAWGRNNVEVVHADDLHDVKTKVAPSKIVIVTGPSFGTAIKFILLGAAIGAGAVHFLGSKNSHKPRKEDTLYEGLTGHGAKDTGKFADRLNGMARRAKSIAGRARDAAHMVSEAAKPLLEDAIKQGKAAAEKTEHELEDELHSPKS